MTAKDYLLQVKRIEIQMNFDFRELEHWRDLSGRISGCNFEAHYNPNRNIEAPYVRCIDKIIDVEQKITREISALVEIKTTIMELIHGLENVDYQSVLELKYLSYYTWEQIANEMHYSLRWIYKLHGKALQEFEKQMEVKDNGIR
ncbi:DUF1492 domain-containing protein [Hespellia stercorisuis]|uniref:Phage transcriptional activator, RinA family n=1 Tax=Hespellia stercorisuis DSM 15480 TaxID=1121950 RepID=A0A1M6IRE6_9FIRM|nr:DUF1492 domain-containing protein [Hespellia stercorisuis]SHJ36957.1 Protein of unknown function [Hespellia stercorisuis DSM 15480]